MRTPTNAELKLFCERDVWQAKKNTDHWRFQKVIDGKLRQTKISFGSGQIGDPSLFSYILRDQLVIDSTEFWRVVDEGGPARRPIPAELIEVAPPDLPAWLRANLLKEGATWEQLEDLDEAEGRQLLEDMRSRNHE